MKRYVRSTIFLAVVAVAILAGCSSVSGTYVDPTGAFSLELKSGGAATFTFANMPMMCTYTQSGNSITLNCPGGAPMVMTVQSDGSLAPPAGSFMPPLKKK